MSNLAGGTGEDIAQDGASAVHGFLSRLREWWAAGSGLSRLDGRDFDRMARDLGMTPQDLTDLAARGPDGAELLYRRMAVQGITRADANRIAHGLMFDLERTCSVCCGKERCERDLAGQPDNPAWRGYCPNATVLDSIEGSRGLFPA